jgi:hypothetical protein
MKKLLLAGVAALSVLTASAAHAQPIDEGEPPPARVTVAPPYSGPPPIGWVYGPYTQCADPPRCSVVVDGWRSPEPVLGIFLRKQQ